MKGSYDDGNKKAMKEKAKKKEMKSKREYKSIDDLRKRRKELMAKNESGSY